MQGVADGEDGRWVPGALFLVPGCHIRPELGGLCVSMLCWSCATVTRSPFFPWPCDDSLTVDEQDAEMNNFYTCYAANPVAGDAPANSLAVDTLRCRSPLMANHHGLARATGGATRIRTRRASTSSVDDRKEHAITQCCTALYCVLLPLQRLPVPQYLLTAASTRVKRVPSDQRHSPHLVDDGGWLWLQHY